MGMEPRGLFHDPRPAAVGIDRRPTIGLGLWTKSGSGSGRRLAAKLAPGACQLSPKRLFHHSSTAAIAAVGHRAAAGACPWQIDRRPRATREPVGTQADTLRREPDCHPTRGRVRASIVLRELSRQSRPACNRSFRPPERRRPAASVRSSGQRDSILTRPFRLYLV
jgi:hypothetical protein